MTDKNEDKQHKALMTVLERIQAPLEIFALLKLADELYTKEERAKLYAEYKMLCDADLAAYENINKALTVRDDNLTREQRVEKYGEAVMTAQVARHQAALEARKVTTRALMAFQGKHRVVVRLLEAQESFPKGRYD